MSQEAKIPVFTERFRLTLLERRVLVLDGVLDDDNGTLLAAQLLTLADEDPAADLRRTRDTVLGLIAADTGQPADRVFEDSRHDHWYTADEAREYGFVDAIAETFGQLMPSRKRPFGLRPADQRGSAS
jgi:ATP-dependent protease ClpP protease subunit